MAFSWGSALESFGKSVPTIGAAYDNRRKLKQEEDAAKRQAVLDDLTAEKNRAAIGTLADEKQRQGEGRKELSGYFNDLALDNTLGGIKGLDEISPISSEPSSQYAMTPITTNYRKPDINKVLPYMDMPEVKGALEYGLDKERIAGASKNKETASGGVFESGTREYDLAKRIANGQITWEQGLQAFVGFGNKTGKREDLVNTVFEINPDFKSANTQGQYRADVTEKQIPVESAKAGSVAAAGTSARENTARDVNINRPQFSGTQAVAVSQSAIAVKNLQLLKEELAKGNVDYFDIQRKTGQFINPKVANAFQQISEIVGRSQSGAAIADSEWKNFGKEILNKNFLLTTEGRQTALANIDDYLDRFYGNGELITSNPNWYTDYMARGRKGREVTANNSASQVREFATEAEAEAAGLKPGTKIKIAGRSATWQ